MFRLWGKIWKDNRLLRDTVICDDSQDTRTHKIFRGLESVCYEMDLGNPIWLDSTVKDFQKHDKARCYRRGRSIGRPLCQSINSRMISLMISSSSGVSILLKWLPAAAVCRILSAICSTISSLEASSGFPAAGVSSVQILTCST